MTYLSVIRTPPHLFLVKRPNQVASRTKTCHGHSPNVAALPPTILPDLIKGLTPHSVKFRVGSMREYSRSNLNNDHEEDNKELTRTKIVGRRDLGTRGSFECAGSTALLLHNCLFRTRCQRCSRPLGRSRTFRCNLGFLRGRAGHRVWLWFQSSRFRRANWFLRRYERFRSCGTIDRRPLRGRRFLRRDVRGFGRRSWLSQRFPRGGNGRPLCRWWTRRSVGAIVHDILQILKQNYHSLDRLKGKLMGVSGYLEVVLQRLHDLVHERVHFVREHVVLDEGWRWNIVFA